MLKKNATVGNSRVKIKLRARIQPTVRPLIVQKPDSLRYFAHCNQATHTFILETAPFSEMASTEALLAVAGGDRDALSNVFEGAIKKQTYEYILDEVLPSLVRGGLLKEAACLWSARNLGEAKQLKKCVSQSDRDYIPRTGASLLHALVLSTSSDNAVSSWEKVCAAAALLELGASVHRTNKEGRSVLQDAAMVDGIVFEFFIRFLANRMAHKTLQAAKLKTGAAGKVGPQSLKRPPQAANTTLAVELLKEIRSTREELRSTHRQFSEMLLLYGKITGVYGCSSEQRRAERRAKHRRRSNESEASARFP